MGRKRFSNEEMAILQASPYVIKVTPSLINFSAEFKQKFWEAYCDGESPRDIVIKLGLDPDILGSNRVNALKGAIWESIKSGRGFSDINTSKGYLDSKISPTTKIKYLEQQLAYKDQELEFLKKIVSLSREEKE